LNAEMQHMKLRKTKCYRKATHPEDCAAVLRVFAKVHDENWCDPDRLALSLSTKRAASAVKESRNASLYPAPPAPRS
jgi:hypothetical protein